MATTGNTALASLNDVMQRSMLTGVSTPEYNAALAAAGFKPGEWWEATQALNAAGYDTNKPTNENILKYGPEIARTGVGGTSYAPGSNIKQSLTDRGLDPSLSGLDEGVNNYYEQAQLNDTSNPLNRKINSLASDLATLTTNYNNLVAKNNRPTTNTSITAGGLTDANAAVDGGGTSNSGATATSGIVYGPDGVMYSSAAAAIAAGVKNYTTTKPAGLIATNNNLSGQFTNAAAGNVNPGGLIGNAQKQLFTNPVTVQGPSVKTTNPFATTPK